MAQAAIPRWIKVPVPVGCESRPDTTIIINPTPIEIRIWIICYRNRERRIPQWKKNPLVIERVTQRTKGDRARVSARKLVRHALYLQGIDVSIFHTRFDVPGVPTRGGAPVGRQEGMT
jgi:hypothetical protein